MVTVFIIVCWQEKCFFVSGTSMIILSSLLSSFSKISFRSSSLLFPFLSLPDMSVYFSLVLLYVACILLSFSRFPAFSGFSSFFNFKLPLDSSNSLFSDFLDSLNSLKSLDSLGFSGLELFCLFLLPLYLLFKTTFVFSFAIAVSMLSNLFLTSFFIL